MISMNISPPRPIEDSSDAMLPAVNARMRNSRRSNIGCGVRSSAATNAASIATPPMSRPSTSGLPQPIVEPPYGWRA